MRTNARIAIDHSTHLQYNAIRGENSTYVQTSNCTDNHTIAEQHHFAKLWKLTSSMFRNNKLSTFQFHCQNTSRTYSFIISISFPQTTQVDRIGQTQHI
uniref:Uncharacterized protein n=1 Tax=Arundo donax TaxID=35708 RepID=A0A0A9GHY0_ARUDO